ncbi:GNAT family N-acetyltransferase [bacterium]|nr:GNAT family N-acetyltransferase [bacterium]
MKEVELIGKDKEKTWELESLSFGMGKNVQKFFNKEIKDFTALAAMEGDTIASTVFHLQRPLHFGGDTFSTCAVSYVASLPEYRNRGYVRQILNGLLKAQAKKGIVLSSLYAFKIEYYRMFGYEVACDALEYEMKPKHFPKIKGEKYPLEYVTEDTLKSYVAHFNKRYFYEYNGMYKKSVKDEKNMDKWMLEHDDAVKIKRIFIGSAKDPKGIFSFHLTKDSKKLVFFDIFLHDRTALNTFLAYAGSFRDQAEKIKMHLAEDMRLEWAMDTFYFTRKSSTRQMIRILGLKELLKRLKVKRGTYRLGIKDDLIPANNGLFLIESDGKKNKVKKVSDSHARIPIGTFCSMLFSSEALGFSLKFNELTLSEKRYLQNLIGRKTSFVTEFF